MSYTVPSTPAATRHMPGPKSYAIKPWSLGIILLNLATDRNPWKSATPNDPTFQAYLHDPMGFLVNSYPVFFLSLHRSIKSSFAC